MAGAQVVARQILHALVGKPEVSSPVVALNGIACQGGFQPWTSATDHFQRREDYSCDETTGLVAGDFARKLACGSTSDVSAGKQQSDDGRLQSSVSCVTDSSTSSMSENGHVAAQALSSSAVKASLLSSFSSAHSNDAQASGREQFLSTKEIIHTLHGNDRHHNCQFCGVSFSSLEALQGHQVVHVKALKSLWSAVNQLNSQLENSPAEGVSSLGRSFPVGGGGAAGSGFKRVHDAPELLSAKRARRSPEVLRSAALFAQVPPADAVLSGQKSIVDDNSLASLLQEAKVRLGTWQGQSGQTSGDCSMALPDGRNCAWTSTCTGSEDQNQYGSVEASGLVPQTEEASVPKTAGTAPKLGGAFVATEHLLYLLRKQVELAEGSKTADKGGKKRAASFLDEIVGKREAAKVGRSRSPGGVASVVTSSVKGFGSSPGWSPGTPSQKQEKLMSASSASNSTFAQLWQQYRPREASEGGVEIDGQAQASVVKKAGKFDFAGLSQPATRALQHQAVGDASPADVLAPAVDLDLHL